MQFAKRIAVVCDRIPEGKVATYGQLAALCGNPRAARQAGGALARGYGKNAHRVVNSRGYLSGADAFLQEGLQRCLLEAEGVPVSCEQTVDLSRYGWQPDEAEETAISELFEQLSI